MVAEVAERVVAEDAARCCGRGAAGGARQQRRSGRRCTGDDGGDDGRSCRLRRPADAAAAEGAAAIRRLAALPADRRAAFDKRMADIDQKWPQGVRATVKDFVNHIDYIVKLIGIDHVGISSDFDGGGGVTGWNSAAETFNVTLELVRRGYTEEQIAQDLERQPASRVGRGRKGREEDSGGQK